MFMMHFLHDRCKEDKQKDETEKCMGNHYDARYYTKITSINKIIDFKIEYCWIKQTL